MKKLIPIYIITLISSSCCNFKSVTIAPSVNYDAARPTAITAAGTVKIEFGGYCPSKTEEQIIKDLRLDSFTLLRKYIADDITKAVYREKQTAIQNSIEHIVSQGKGLDQQRPIVEKVTKAIATAPSKVVSGVSKTVASTVNAEVKTQTVISPAADPTATEAKKQKAVAEAKEISK